MITLHDLDEAIMECQGVRSPDANTCIKLAAFYTIKQHMYPSQEHKEAEPPQLDRGYSYGAGPGVLYSGDSDYAMAVNGKDQLAVFSVMDELMETLKVINPGLYKSVMRRLE